ncbi:uncharacterized protein N7496_005921 [Penicillium cataractarum]|uniref:Asl1-like glycosyl hydrolase catalytic domain-containing protein n=1 Tax=Penicillium cataractarum TaxID=2100454 RepID=A0A9W9S3B0_9EURO|nr:uncharacterized protein N7496_005921 [Penicillium cataractarum]KAJ5369829.1 hypothetical protein N7496_005921 [Penicillium cataractarum]
MVSFTKLFTTGLLATSALAIPVAKPVTVEVQKRNSTLTSKRGAAYNDISTVSPLSSAGTVSWAYNWAMSLSGSLPSNVDYVPMLWGAKDFGGWVTAIETALSSGSNYILGFNEPDMTSQADMSASQAASYYKTYITPYSGKAKLISPAVTSSTTSGLGLSWFKEFMSDCSSCGISGLAVHWYGNTADEFKSFVTQAASTASSYGLSELWVTEFALNSDAGGVADAATTASFLETVIPWLDANTNVTRYSYFMCADNYLLTNNALNQAGQAYTS